MPRRPRRWCGSLDPSLNKSAWTEDEVTRLLRLEAEMGHSWGAIAVALGTGRSELAVRNQFYSRQRFLARHPQSSGAIPEPSLGYGKRFVAPVLDAGVARGAMALDAAGSSSAPPPGYDARPVGWYCGPSRVATVLACAEPPGGRVSAGAAAAAPPAQATLAPVIASPRETAAARSGSTLGGAGTKRLRAGHNALVAPSSSEALANLMSPSSRLLSSELSKTASHDSNTSTTSSVMLAQTSSTLLSLGAAVPPGQASLARSAVRGPPSTMRAAPGLSSSASAALLPVSATARSGASAYRAAAPGSSAAGAAAAAAARAAAATPSALAAEQRSRLLASPGPLPAQQQQQPQQQQQQHQQPVRGGPPGAPPGRTLRLQASFGSLAPCASSPSLLGAGAPSLLGAATGPAALPRLSSRPQLLGGGNGDGGGGGSLGGVFGAGMLASPTSAAAVAAAAAAVHTPAMAPPHFGMSGVTGREILSPLDFVATVAAAVASAPTSYDALRPETSRRQWPAAQRGGGGGSSSGGLFSLPQLQAGSKSSLGHNATLGSLGSVSDAAPGAPGGGCGVDAGGTLLLPSTSPADWAAVHRMLPPSSRLSMSSPRGPGTGSTILRPDSMSDLDHGVGPAPRLLAHPPPQQHSWQRGSSSLGSSLSLSFGQSAADPMPVVAGARALRGGAGDSMTPLQSGIRSLSVSEDL